MTTTPVQVDPSNADTAEAWNGYDGDHWVRWADLYDRSVASYHEALIDAGRISVRDRVLDIGCGNGQTTRAAAVLATGGAAIGVDISFPLVQNARRIAREQGITNATFVHADAQIHPFEAASFDVAISRTGAMFFGDPVAAFRNVRRALRQGGRLALLVWQSPAHNEWITDFLGALTAGRAVQQPPPGVPGPFSLADPDRVHAILGAAGFTDTELASRRGPMWFGQHADDAYQFVTSLGLARWLLTQLDDDRRSSALDALRRTIDSHATDIGVRYDSAAWIVTAAH